MFKNGIPFVFYYSYSFSPLLHNHYKTEKVWQEQKVVCTITPQPMPLHSIPVTQNV